MNLELIYKELSEMKATVTTEYNEEVKGYISSIIFNNNKISGFSKTINESINDAYNKYIKLMSSNDFTDYHVFNMLEKSVEEFKKERYKYREMYFYQNGIRITIRLDEDLKEKDIESRQMFKGDEKCTI